VGVTVGHDIVEGIFVGLGFLIVPVGMTLAAFVFIKVRDWSARKRREQMKTELPKAMTYESARRIVAPRAEASADPDLATYIALRAPAAAEKVRGKIKRTKK
jgi:hypothetical protein